MSDLPDNKKKNSKQEETSQLNVESVITSNLDEGQRMILIEIKNLIFEKEKAQKRIDFAQKKKTYLKDEMRESETSKENEDRMRLHMKGINKEISNALNDIEACTKKINKLTARLRSSQEVTATTFVSEPPLAISSTETVSQPLIIDKPESEENTEHYEEIRPRLILENKKRYEEKLIKKSRPLTIYIPNEDAIIQKNKQNSPKQQQQQVEKLAAAAKNSPTMSTLKNEPQNKSDIKIAFKLMERGGENEYQVSRTKFVLEGDVKNHVDDVNMPNINFQANRHFMTDEKNQNSMVTLKIYKTDSDSLSSLLLGEATLNFEPEKDTKTAIIFDEHNMIYFKLKRRI